MTKPALSLLLFPLLLRADFTAARWQFRRSLPVERPQPVCAVRLDRVTYAAARADLADLRVLREGDEIPYVLETLSGGSEYHEMQPEMLNKAAVPGAGVQVTLDLGAAPAKHDRLRVGAGEKNFRRRVRIETSDDRKRWAIARDDGYIFDVSQGDRPASSLTVDYPVSTRRYVRATFFGWANPAAVQRVWLAYHAERPEVRETTASLEPQRAEDAKTQSTVLDVDLGVAGLPHDRAQIETPAPSFQRDVEADSSPDGRQWRFAGRGAIHRLPGGDSLAVRFAEQHDRYLRLRIFNRDNQPLPISSVMIDAPARRVTFECRVPGRYWLYSGNQEARRPGYDLAAILSSRQVAAERLTALGPQERNPDYRPPPSPAKPWSDRHPIVLYGALTAAVVVMGSLSLRLLLKAKSA